MVDGEPNLTLGIEDTAQVRPSHGKVRSSLYGFQITGLDGEYGVRTMLERVQILWMMMRMVMKII